MEDVRGLLDIIDAQVWQFTDPETYGKVNTAHADFLGLTKEQMEYKKPHDIWPEKTSEALLSGNIIMFEKAITIYSLNEIENHNGQLHYISVTKKPKLDNEKKVGYVVCTGVDVTEYKKSENIIKIAGEIAHDMNQPLQGISGYCELILMDLTKDDPVNEQLNIILEHVVRMKNLIKKLQIISMKKI
jgi:PAS domain S-box-containing protein